MVALTAVVERWVYAIALDAVKITISVVFIIFILFLLLFSLLIIIV